jgi:hypothetical protein
MALSILDGNQSATTLSTILSSGQHITAHTVISLGTQAITDIQSAVSGSVVSISNFPASQSTTFGAVTGSVSVLNFPASQAVTFTDASLTNTQLRASVVTIGGTVTVGNNLIISSLPAISGTVTANTFAVQGTAVTTSNFTSTTASTVLASFNATREVLTIFNEGAGNLHIAPGVTCTTIAYQVRLSAGDYYEVPNHQTTITHSAVFATAGTARVCQVS